MPEVWPAFLLAVCRGSVRLENWRGLFGLRDETVKPLTERQPMRCENAVHSRCRCRCRGLAHGRQTYFRFEDLSEDDPHRVASRAEPMRGATTSAGNEGLTDHSTRDLDGPRPAPVA